MRKMQSMTGIGEYRITRDGFDAAIVIRTVNHRYYQAQIRMPHGFMSYESKLRERIAGELSRGKIDVFVDIYNFPPDFHQIVVNKGMAKNMLQICSDLADEFGISSGLDAEKLLRYPEMTSQAPNSKMAQDLWSVLDAALTGALDRLKESRAAEGKALETDLRARCEAVRRLMPQILRFAGDQMETIKSRLQANLQKIMPNVSVDESRLEQEIAMAAMKADISEEIVRFESHLKRFETLLGETKPVAKAADFLVQEMNREINTIGSKSADKRISDLVVDVKIEVEKIREQIQNIE
jgi:uncharacterized protein (TIGR00255 family)